MAERAGETPLAARRDAAGARHLLAESRAARRPLPPAPSAATWRLLAAVTAALYLLALPAAALWLAHRVWVRRKALVGLGEKLCGDGAAVPPGQVLVHGVSLGEVMLMRPLVPRIEAALGARCLLTTSSETGRKALDEHFPAHHRAWFPFDLPWTVDRFLARTQPRLVVLLELEVWPVFLALCHARGIPVALVNARVSARSFAGYRRAGVLLRPLLRHLALAAGQNGTWTARLIALGVPRTRAAALGSMKADMVRPADAAAATAEALRLGLDSGRPLLLLASTGPGEERAALADTLAAWHARGWQVAICPRHPERGAEIAALIATLGATARRSSLGERVLALGEVPVIDEIGRLAALYRLVASSAGIAVVGGSLGSGRGGQNMLEAAAAGGCTVVGPDTRNFPDAMALLRAAAGVVESAIADLPATLATLADDAPRRRALGAAGQRAWQAGLGATARVVARLAAC